MEFITPLAGCIYLVLLVALFEVDQVWTFALARNASWVPGLVDLLSFFPIFVLIGLRRFDAGFDTPYYISTFNSLSGLGDARDVGELVFGNTEILFWPAQALFKLFFESGRLWLVFLITFEYISILMAYRRLSLLTGCIASAGVFVFYTYEMVYFGNVMRQALAVPFVLWGILYCLEGKYLRFIALMAVAVGMHWSAFAFFAVPAMIFVLKTKWRGLMLLVLFLAIVSGAVAPILEIVLGNNSDIGDQVERYAITESHFGSVTGTVNFWLCIVLGLMALGIQVFSSNLRVTGFLAGFWLALTVALGGRAIPDLSERFFPYVFVFAPFIAFEFGDEVSRMFNLPQRFVRTVVVIIFGLLLFAVLNQPSSQQTLGIVDF